MLFGPVSEFCSREGKAGRDVFPYLWQVEGGRLVHL